MESLRSFVDHSTLFAFDLDGTLTAITTNPGDIVLTPEIRSSLVSLARSAAVAIITGRSRSDALAHLGFHPNFLIGNHGSEGLPGWEEKETEFTLLCANWEIQMRHLLHEPESGGIAIENKGTTLSIHYRSAPQQAKARALILKSIRNLTPAPRRVGGKCIVNLIPAEAPHKGTAMLHLMALSGLSKGFYAGDDVTDEDVFRLDDDHLFTVRVGGSRTSHARFALRGYEDMTVLLKAIVSILTKIKNAPPTSV